MLLLLLACGEPDTQPDPADSPSPTDSEPQTEDTALCADGTSYTWDNFGRQFFVDYCENCHNYEHPDPDVEVGMVFDDEDYVWEMKDRILWRVVNAEAAGAPPMPPPADEPTEDMDVREFAINKELDLLRLAEWLNCGTPGAR